MASSPGPGGPIVPTLRYHDAPAAIRFLCEAFGFVERMVVPGDGETIAHAQLTFPGGAASGMIMLGSARDDEFGKLQAPPERGQPVHQSPYVIVPEIEAHYARARAAGAEIVMELADQDYGGKLYAVRDPEGYLWNFGSYDPWNV